MVPVLFPGAPGGLELLVVLLIALVLLGLPLFLLVVGGFGYWRLGRGRTGGEDPDEETVAELRRRVDEMEAQLTDAGDRESDGRAGVTDADPDRDTSPTGSGDREGRPDE